MTTSPTMQSDSISFKIKELFDQVVTDKSAHFGKNAKIKESRKNWKIRGN
jgi:hypothetical protein